MKLAPYYLLAWIVFGFVGTEVARAAGVPWWCVLPLLLAIGLAILVVLS